MFISIPDSSATNNTGLLVNLFEMITSDILSLSSSFKRTAKLLILLFIFLSLSFLVALFSPTFDKSTLPFEMDLKS